MLAENRTAEDSPREDRWLSIIWILWDSFGFYHILLCLSLNTLFWMWIEIILFRAEICLYLQNNIFRMNYNQENPLANMRVQQDGGYKENSVRFLISLHQQEPVRTCGWKQKDSIFKSNKDIHYPGICPSKKMWTFLKMKTKVFKGNLNRWEDRHTQYWKEISSPQTNIYQFLSYLVSHQDFEINPISLSWNSYFRIHVHEQLK